MVRNVSQQWVVLFILEESVLRPQVVSRLLVENLAPLHLLNQYFRGVRLLDLLLVLAPTLTILDHGSQPLPLRVVLSDLALELLMHEFALKRNLLLLRHLHILLLHGVVVVSDTASVLSDRLLNLLIFNLQIIELVPLSLDLLALVIQHLALSRKFLLVVESVIFDTFEHVRLFILLHLDVDFFFHHFVFYAC